VAVPARLEGERQARLDLPTGQCSFHSAERLQGPEYAGEWDKDSDSTSAILAFCDQVELRSKQTMDEPSPYGPCLHCGDINPQVSGLGGQCIKCGQDAYA
jgi:hypothetical protein